jgi:hypothetical protein
MLSLLLAFFGSRLNRMGEFSPDLCEARHPFGRAGYRTCSAVGSPFPDLLTTTLETK